ncbi:hypothetical protein [Breznakiella homolactica]|uniref:Polysaccharide chain length determinant N-terminal domain-containing protein n=1 Tax=Breznakiella homolactica TaxID=2798577 RepID=A0A7T8BB97_9SPIR|nr:hypothetical protein [Breznakiella homolactica]QQO09815.1 hypothetical protein JFL75_02585 [Breznakiella homolactica]
MKEENNNDDFGLIDIFVVLLRYRVLLVSVSLSLFLLIFCGFFFIPKNQYVRASKNQYIEGTMTIAINPAIVDVISTTELVAIFNQSDILINSFLDIGIKEYEIEKNIVASFVDEMQYARSVFLIENRFIKNLDIDGKPLKNPEDKIFSVTMVAGNTNNNENNVIKIMFRDKDKEKVSAFLYALHQHGDELVFQSISNSLYRYILNYELMFNISHPSDSIIKILENEYNRYIFYKSIFDQESSAVLIVQGPSIKQLGLVLESYSKKYIKGGVILFLGFFIITLLIAFILNAINNIKNDSRSMKKIYSALGRNK